MDGGTDGRMVSEQMDKTDRWQDRWENKCEAGKPGKDMRYNAPRYYMKMIANQECVKDCPQRACGNAGVWEAASV